MAQADAATAGRWREEPVWIGGETFSPHEADFVPPRADLVPGCMADLVDFTARDDIVALAQAAVAHAQFETIHPFTDGNGRTGRALIHAMLRAKGVARNVSVPISAGLLTDTGGYFDALTSYREGDLGPIVSKMATAALDGIDNGRMLVHDLREVRRTWQDRIGARRDSVAWKIAGALPRQPVVDAAWVQSTFGATNANALLALKGLENDGLLVSYQMTKRTRAWRSQEILACLDRFAARAGRRGGL
ncbi:MAG: Fic family protein [Actinomycetota bacterium]|nr:Fic family protein [Actinomycetota bacterium]